MNKQSLPITRGLSLAYILSTVSALLVAGASLAGILLKDALYPTEELYQSFIANDVVNLLIGLPILLGSMALARRGRLVGLLFWPGALLFITYNSIAYAAAMPLTWVFAINLVLVLMSIFTIYLLLTSMNSETIREQLKGKVPEKFPAGVLAGLGILFFIWRGMLAIQAVSGQATLTTPEMATIVADLLITPTWVTGGILLWRHKAFGYICGAGLLFQASMLFVGLLVFFILQPFVAAVPFALEDFIAILSMGLVCFIPFGLFVRGILSKGKRL